MYLRRTADTEKPDGFQKPIRFTVISNKPLYPVYFAEYNSLQSRFALSRNSFITAKLHLLRRE